MSNFRVLSRRYPSGMDLLGRLLGHDTWTTTGLLRQSRALTEAQLNQEFDLGWRTVRATLDHIIDNMETWVDLMNKCPFAPVLSRPRTGPAWAASPGG